MCSCIRQPYSKPVVYRFIQELSEPPPAPRVVSALAATRAERRTVLRRSANIMATIIVTSTSNITNR